MKAIIVADNKKAVDNIAQVLEIAGYDVIVYKWLLKALDNIEEIKPHLIIVNAKEYPRHWKTITQFAKSAFGAYKPQIILFTDGDFPYEEYEKAQILRVRGMFDSADVKGLDQLRAIIAKTDDIYSGKLSEKTIGKESKTIGKVEKQITESQISKIKSEIEVDKIKSEEIADFVQIENDSLPCVQSASQEEPPENKNIPLLPRFDFDENEPVLAEINIFENDFNESEFDRKIDSVDKSVRKIEGIINSLCRLIEKIKNKFAEKVDSAKRENVYYSVLLTDPDSGVLITGYGERLSQKTIEFVPGFDENIKDFFVGKRIENISMRTSAKTIKKYSAVVTGNSNSIILELEKL